MLPCGIPDLTGRVVEGSLQLKRNEIIRLDRNETICTGDQINLGLSACRLANCDQLSQMYCATSLSRLGLRVALGPPLPDYRARGVREHACTHHRRKHLALYENYKSQNMCAVMYIYLHLFSFHHCL